MSSIDGRLNEDLHRQQIVLQHKILKRMKSLVEKKLTSKWLSEQLGKNPATISKWCTNTSQPDLVTLTKVAALLDVDVRQLINKTKGTNSDD